MAFYSKFDTVPLMLPLFVFMLHLNMIYDKSANSYVAELMKIGMRDKKFNFIDKRKYL